MLFSDIMEETAPPMQGYGGGLGFMSNYACNNDYNEYLYYLERLEYYMHTSTGVATKPVPADHEFMHFIMQLPGTEARLTAAGYKDVVDAYKKLYPGKIG